MSKMKAIARPLLFHGGLPLMSIARRRLEKNRSVFILLYHKVNHRAAPFFGVAVTPGDFEKHIRFLKKHYEVVDLSSMHNGNCSPSSSKDLAVITFDDGYRDNFVHAYPILKKHEVPATIFLPTDYIGTNRLLWHDKLAWILYNTAIPPSRKALIGAELPHELIEGVDRFFAASTANRVPTLRIIAEMLKHSSPETRKASLARLAKACNVKDRPANEDRPMLSWDEIRTMSGHGISFGSHTKSHPVLSEISLQRVQEEIAESKNTIEQHIQKEVTTFAYPFGKEKDYSPEVQRILLAEGFKYGFTAILGRERLPLENPLSLKRKGVGPNPYLFL